MSFWKMTAEQFQGQEGQGYVRQSNNLKTLLQDEERSSESPGVTSVQGSTEG